MAKSKKRGWPGLNLGAGDGDGRGRARSRMDYVRSCASEGSKVEERADAPKIVSIVYLAFRLAASGDV